jgi:hypothetical protein
MPRTIKTVSAAHLECGGPAGPPIIMGETARDFWCLSLVTVFPKKSKFIRTQSSSRQLSTGNCCYCCFNVSVGQVYLCRAKQKPAKVHLSRRVGGQTQEGPLYWGFQDLKLSLRSAEISMVSPGKLANVSLTLRDLSGRGRFLVLDGQIGAVIFCGLQGLQASKILLYVTSYSVKVSSLGCDSWFPNSLLSPHQRQLFPFFRRKLQS